MAITITPAVANIGGNITVSLPAGCRCRVQLYLGTKSLTDGTYENEAEISLPAKTWLPLLPDCGDTRSLPAAQAPWVLVEIYDGTGQYKETAEKRFDVVVGSQYAPELDWLLSAKNDLSQVLNPAYKSMYFQGVTQVLAQTEVRCWTGAKLKKITLQVDGKTYESDTEEVVSDALSSMGQVPVTITATDTRGLSTSYTETIEVTPYARPVAVLGGQGVFRCSSTGNPDPGGTNLYVHAAPRVYPLSKENTGGIRIRVTPVGYTPGAFSQTPLAAQGVVSGVQLAPEYNYLVELQPYDMVCQGNILSVTIPKQAIYAHQKDAALALGMYSEKGGLEVAWPARFYSPVFLGNTALTESALKKLLQLI